MTAATSRRRGFNPQRLSKRALGVAFAIMLLLFGVGGLLLRSHSQHDALTKQLEAEKIEQEDQARQLKAMQSEVAQLTSQLEMQAQTAVDLRREMKEAAEAAEEDLRGVREQCKRSMQDAHEHLAKAEQAVAEDVNLRMKLETEVKQRHAAEHARDLAVAERDATAAERDTMAAERDTVNADRDTVAAERDAALRTKRELEVHLQEAIKDFELLEKELIEQGELINAQMELANLDKRQGSADVRNPRGEGDAVGRSELPGNSEADGALALAREDGAASNNQDRAHRVVDLAEEYEDDEPDAGRAANEKEPQPRDGKRRQSPVKPRFADDNDEPLIDKERTAESPVAGAEKDGVDEEMYDDRAEYDPEADGPDNDPDNGGVSRKSAAAENGARRLPPAAEARDEQERLKSKDPNLKARVK